MRKFLLGLFGLLPRRPSGHPPFAFLDDQGLEYYAWKDLSEMPPARCNEVEDIMLQIDGCMTHKTRESIANGISHYIQEAMSAASAKLKGNALAKANYLAMELLVRPKKIIPEECYFAMAAICAVRRDEDPYTFDKQIHQEKINAFRLAGRAGHAFFTGTGPFRTMLPVSLSTEEGLRDLQRSWIVEAARAEAIWRLMSLPPAEANEVKSSEPLSKTRAGDQQQSTKP